MRRRDHLHLVPPPVPADPWREGVRAAVLAILAGLFVILAWTVGRGLLSCRL